MEDFIDKMVPDDLDGCELDFVEAEVPEEVVEFLPLFPDSKPTNKWDGVFD